MTAASAVRERIRRNSDRERGAIAAEMAIVLPVLVLLLFGMIQLGLAFQRKEVLNAGAREGARVASLPTSSIGGGEGCTRATNSLAATSFDAAPGCSQTGDCSLASQNVTITLTVQNQIEIPFFGSPTITLTGEGTFRCE